MAGRRPGQFALIARYFAPLARNFPGAGNLESDNAFLPANARHDLVVKTDTIVAGVHFLPGERPERIAAKAIRVCLSDLAAGGATPYAYQLSLALSPRWTERWIAAFVRGLRADQRRYGITLCGGDTVATPGPLTITVTAFGRVPRGRGLSRAGAMAGDELWVSGTIGDAALGLLAARRRLRRISLWRDDIACLNHAPSWGRVWSALSMRPPTSPMGCWPMPAISPKLRGSGSLSNASACRCHARRAVSSTATLRSGPPCWAEATTTSW